MVFVNSVQYVMLEFAYMFTNILIETKSFALVVVNVFVLFTHDIQYTIYIYKRWVLYSIFSKKKNEFIKIITKYEWNGMEF